MGQLLVGVLGWSVLLLGAIAISVAVCRRAKVNGVLAPVLVGVGLRLVVMLIAHIASHSLGERGMLFVDDETYYRGGALMADLWSHGHTPNPSPPDVLGTYQFGYQIFLGVLFTLGTTSVLLAKLVNVLIGGITILLMALLGGRVLGERAKVRAAWLTALAPSFIWWSAPLLKEALVTMLIVVALLAITYLPRTGAVIALALVVAPMLITRGPAAFALLFGVALAVLIAGRRAEGRWLSRPLISFTLLLGGGFLVVAVVVSGGHLDSLFRQYQHGIHNMVSEYNAGSPAHIPFDAAKSLVTPLPWVFDEGTRNWDRGLYPGVWFVICALPLAALGIWRLRSRPEAWAMLGTAGAALLLTSFLSGYVFRQRSMLEPVILLFALAGMTSWRMAARSVSATLAVVAVAAGVQSRAPGVVAVIALAALGVLALSRRLPVERFEQPPESRMVENFRRWAAARQPDRGGPFSRVLGEARRLLGIARDVVVGARAAVMSHAPRPRDAKAGGAAGRSWLARVSEGAQRVAPPLGRQRDAGEPGRRP